MTEFKKDYYADVRIEDRASTTVEFLNGDLKESKVRREKRAFIRVYDGNMWYYASTTDVNHIQSTLEELYSVAKPNPDIENNPIVKKFQRNKAHLETFKNNSVRDISLEEKTELLKFMLPAASSDSCMTMPLGRYLDRSSLFSFCSSLGADISYDYQTCGVVLRCDMVEGDKKLSGNWQQGETDFGMLKSYKDDADKALKEQAEYMRNSVACDQGDFPVVLSPEAAGVFAHESFGHKSESDFMLSDESMKKEWELGKQVGSKLLSIAEYGDVLGPGYTPYDDEGTKAQKNYLIKDGILAGRLHSVTTAAVLEEEVTGNARAVDCTFEPIVRMTNTYIEGGELTFDELIAPIKKGYYIKSVKHGSGMSTFTIAPHVAYEIKDGKISRPVQISVITGSVFETLGLVDGLTKEYELKAFVSGGCGKMEQSPLPVGFGAPYVRVSKMKVQ
ncbi:MAG: TldD/PmbA family protein [Ruminococcaceae bacterium]|nr:TldD/PmbA family protein [Oscillospiraceae bacterium]